jgi:hypothetical protein
MPRNGKGDGDGKGDGTEKGTRFVSAIGAGFAIMPVMPRGPRNAPGGVVYHCLNRGVARATLFHKDGDYAAFERVLAEGMARHPTRLLAYCLMPNHWHAVLWPRRDGEVMSTSAAIDPPRRAAR